VARYRTIHIDLPAWDDCPPLAEIVRVAVVLAPSKKEPLTYVAAPTDASRRRYAAHVPADPQARGWLSAGTYALQVLVWVGEEAHLRKWVVEDRETGARELAVKIAEEPRRPLAGAPQAAE
jgi:hypothetical protein